MVSGKKNNQVKVNNFAFREPQTRTSNGHLAAFNPFLTSIYSSPFLCIEPSQPERSTNQIHPTTDLLTVYTCEVEHTTNILLSFLLNLPASTLQVYGNIKFFYLHHIYSNE